MFFRKDAEPQTFCHNCKFYSVEPALTFELQVCLNTGRDIVTGKRVKADAYWMRGTDGPCGPSGKLWEPIG